jgi:hypothetical protein
LDILKKKKLEEVSLLYAVESIKELGVDAQTPIELSIGIRSIEI